MRTCECEIVNMHKCICFLNPCTFDYVNTVYVAFVLCARQQHDDIKQNISNNKSNTVNLVEEKKITMAMDLFNFNPVIEIGWVIGINKEKKTCIS